ncbi:MAG TPA: AI-2E family transporter [Egibacteraceae bacterium]|nr:AI-2E family transporter [Egibacteraceae bacterium]
MEQTRAQLRARLERALRAGPEAEPAPRRAVRVPGRLSERPTVRAGVYAWALVGILAIALAAGVVIARIAVVVIPLVLAAFPAAVLVPPTRGLRNRGVPPAAAALIVLLASFGLIAGLFSLLAPSVAAELEGLGQEIERGYGQVRAFLEAGPFGLQPIALDQFVERVRASLTTSDDLGRQVMEAGVAVAEGVAGVALALFALFFYLKDGPRIAAWLRDLFPQWMRADVEAIGVRTWTTLSDYIRGQLVIALVDAVFIGVGIAIIGVPLVLPLSVLVFVGGLFPIVGALLSGAVAVLVALATGSVVDALLVLAVVVGVQQLESHVLAPVVLGRATALHPLAVISALAAGGVLLGVLGAFLAVPITASAARAVGYLRNRVPG